MTGQIDILIVEDEAITAEGIKSMLSDLGYGIAGIASNALDAVDILSSKKVDLAILDINIQGEKDGIWVASYIQKSYDIPHIFLTAFEDKHTLEKAIKTKPSGYLIKPFHKATIMSSLEVTLVNYTSQKTALYEEMQSLSSVEKKELLQNKASFYIKNKEAFIRLSIDDIYFIESNRNYATISLKDDSYLVKKSLKKIIGVLPDYFIQTHRSFIVNTRKIENIKNLSIQLASYTLPLGKSYKDRLFKKINII